MSATGRDLNPGSSLRGPRRAAEAPRPRPRPRPGWSWRPLATPGILTGASVTLTRQSSSRRTVTRMSVEISEPAVRSAMHLCSWMLSVCALWPATQTGSAKAQFTQQPGQDEGHSKPVPDTMHLRLLGGLLQALLPPCSPMALGN